MKRKLLFLGIIIVLSGCNFVSGGLKGSKPPEAYLEIDGEKYETTLGAYCWKTECVDTAGPKELLEGEAPILVEAGKTITFRMDYEPKPDEVHLSQLSEDDDKEVEVKDHTFTAPSEKGIYYYSYGVWWSDKKEENVSNGDAFYAFALEVE